LSKFSFEKDLGVYNTTEGKRVLMSRFFLLGKENLGGEERVVLRGN